MPSDRLSRIVSLALLLATPLSLIACSKSAPPDGGPPAADMAAPSPAKPPPPAASRTVSKKSEWSIGGLVGGKTETVTSEPMPAPPVIEEQPLPPAQRRPQPQSGVLTAGDVDDLLNPAQYAAYAERFLQAHNQALPFVDTRSRVVVRVVDARGQPVPFAHVELRRTDAPLRLVTAVDGTASFYPRLDRLAGQTTVAVTSSAGNASRSVSLGGSRTIGIALPGLRRAAAAMDVALVLDTTGSMGDEMDYLRAELDAIVARLRWSAPDLDLRIGVILYRDEGDRYVVKSTQLTGDIGAIRDLLAQQDASGGGDMPEALDQAMAAAGQLQWRPDAAKAVLLVTDAPPHDDKLAATIEAAQRLRSIGVQIVPVGASGVEDNAQYVLRTMAALTQGRYIFLTDDSGVGDQHAEPDVACYVVTHLDQLVSRVLAGIATGRRIEPRPEDVIRRVGDYDKGRCRTAAQN